MAQRLLSLFPHGLLPSRHRLSKLRYIDQILRGVPLFCSGTKPNEEYEFFNSIYEAAREYGSIMRLALSSIHGVQPNTVFVEYLMTEDARMARAKLGFQVSLCSSPVFREYLNNIKFVVLKRYVPSGEHNQQVLRVLSMIKNPLGASGPRDFLSKK